MSDKIKDKTLNANNVKKKKINIEKLGCDDYQLP